MSRACPRRNGNFVAESGGSLAHSLHPWLQSAAPHRLTLGPAVCSLRRRYGDIVRVFRHPQTGPTLPIVPTTGRARPAAVPFSSTSLRRSSWRICWNRWSTAWTHNRRHAMSASRGTRAPTSAAAATTSSSTTHCAWPAGRRSVCCPMKAASPRSIQARHPAPGAWKDASELLKFCANRDSPAACNWMMYARNPKTLLHRLPAQSHDPQPRRRGQRALLERRSRPPSAGSSRN